MFFLSGKPPFNFSFALFPAQMEHHTVLSLFIPHQQLNSWQRRIPSGVSLLLFCRFAVFSQPYKNNDCSSRIKASRLSFPFCSLTDAEQDILTYEAKKIPSQSIRWYILSFFFLLLFCPCRNVKFPPSKPHSTDLYGANIFPFTQWVDGSPLNKSKFLSLLPEPSSLTVSWTNG